MVRLKKMGLTQNHEAITHQNFIVFKVQCFIMWKGPCEWVDNEIAFDDGVPSCVCRYTT